MTKKGSVTRLTAGWRRSGRPASLHEHARQHGQLPPLHSGQDLIDEVAAAGLTGRGGAGFPVGTKMRGVAAQRGPKVLVANGMESEPASRKDESLLASSPHLVLDGIELAASAVGAETAHLCLPRTGGGLADLMLKAVEDRRRHQVGTVPVEVRQLPHDYVSSEQTSLVSWLNGGLALPTGSRPRPSERGVGKRPTLVHNVETLANVALIARHGADWFKDEGTQEAPGTMLMTITGAVAEPGVYEMANGALVGDVLSAVQADEDVEAVLIGGYFGTWHQVSEVAGLPFSKAGLAGVDASPGAGVLFALPANRCGLAEAAGIARYLAGQSARQCGPCMFGLPAIAGDLTQLADGRPEGEPLDRMDRRFGQISGRGACRHPDGAVRNAESALSAFAADARAHADGRPCLAARQGRQLPGTEPATQGDWR